MNNFAISSTGIGEALQRSASALAGAGNTMEESIGLITAMNNVVQNPTMVGTALKTMTMYLRAAKTEAEESGESTEGMASSVSKLRSELMSLSGVDIMLDENTFKSTYQILKELSEVWDELTDISRANILERIGGKRGANSISSLIQNFGDAEKAMLSATESMGSATRENEEFLNSIAGKLTTLRAAFEQLASDTIGSRLVKTGVDIVTQLTNAVDLLMKAHVILPSIVASVLLITKQRKESKLNNLTTELFSHLNSKESGSWQAIFDQMTVGMSKAEKQAVATRLEMMGLSQGFITVSASSKTLAGSIKALWTSLGTIRQIVTVISVAIGIGQLAYDAYNKSIQDAIENADRVSEAYESAKSSSESNIKSLEGLRERYDALSEKIDENKENLGLNKDEYDEYLGILDKVIAISPSIVKGYDEERQAIVDYRTAIDDAIASEQERVRLAEQAKVLSQDDIVKASKNQYKESLDDAQKAWSRIRDIVGQNQKWMGLFGDNSVYESQISAVACALEQLGIATGETADNMARGLDIMSEDQLGILAEYSDEFITLLAGAQAFDDVELSNIRTQISSLVVEYDKVRAARERAIEPIEIKVRTGADSGEEFSWYNNIPINAMDEFHNAMVDSLNLFDSTNAQLERYGQIGAEYAEALSSDVSRSLMAQAQNLDGSLESLGAYNANVAEYISGLRNSETYTESTIAILETYFNNLGQQMYNTASVASDTESEINGSLENTVEAVNDITKAFDQLKKSYDVLSKAMDEMSGDGGLSMDTVMDIAGMLSDGERLTDYIYKENGLLLLNAEAWKNRATALMEADMSANSDKIRELGKENARLQDEYSKETDSQKRAGIANQIKENIAAIIRLSKENSIYAAGIKSVTDAVDGESNALDSLNTSLDSAAELTTILNDISQGTKSDLEIIEELEKYASSTDGVDLSNLIIGFKDGEIQYNTEALTKAKDAIFETIQAFEDANPAVSGLTEYLRTLVDAGDDTAASIKEMGDAMSRMKEINEFRTLFGKSDASQYDIVNSAIKLAGDDISKLSLLIKQFNADGTVEFNENGIDTFLDACFDTEGVLSDLETQFPGITAYMKSMASAADETTISYEGLSNAISNLSSITSILTNMNSNPGNVTGMLTDLINLSEKLNVPLSTFVSASDGMFEWNRDALFTQYEAQFDGLVDEIEGGSEAIRKAFDNMMDAESLDAALSAVSTASGILTDISKDDVDIVSVLGDISKLAQASGKSMTDFFTVTEGQISISEEAIKSYADNLIDSMTGLGEHSEAIKNELKEQVRAEVESVTEFEKLEKTMSSVTSAADLYKSAQEEIISSGKSSIDTLQELMSQYGEQWTQYVDYSEGNFRIDTDKIKENVFAQIDALDNVAPEIREQLKREFEMEVEPKITIDLETEGFANFTKAISESVSATGLSNESMKNLEQRYRELEGYNPETLFDRTTHGIMLNVQALNELEAAYVKQKKQDILLDLEKLQAEYENLTEQINNCADASEKDALYGARDAILAQITDTKNLAAQYDGLVNAYNRWKTAQSGGEAGDEYDDVIKGMEQAHELYKEGLVGTNEFKAAAQYYTNQDLSGASIEEIVAAYERGYPLMQRYFTDGDKGARRFLKDVENLNSDWVHMNEDGTWEINFGVGGDQEVADALGISTEAVQAILKKLVDYGFTIDLDSIFDAPLKSAIDRLDEFKKEDGTIDLSLEGASEALAEVQRLIKARQQLERPAVMSVTVSSVTDESLSGTLALLQQFWQANEDYELAVSVNGEGSAEAAEKLTAVQTALDALQSDNGLVNLGLNPESLVSIEGAVTAISSITGDQLITLGVNADAITNYVPEQKTADVVYSEDTSNLRDKFSATGIVKWNNDITRVKTKFEADGKVNWSNTEPPKTGVGRFTGTAFANGNAFATGNWGTKSGGTALVGELGQELLVSSQGMYRTVGDNGAEFIRYRKGDIIFNADQTEQIFKYGRIINGQRRGKAFLNGTADGVAFSSGSGAFTKPSASLVTTTTKTTVSSGTSSKSTTSALDKIKKKYDELLAALQHLIEHQEFLFDQAEKGYDYNGMMGAVAEEANIYKQMMDEAADAVEKMKKKGAKDTDKALQEMEKAYWNAYRNMYDSLERMNKLLPDALNDRIDDLQQSYSNLMKAAEDFAETGYISVDTFQDLAEHGIQYLAMLKDVDGQYVINKENIDKLIEAEKEQLAIESALSYLNNLSIALGDKDFNAVDRLVDASQEVSNNTWDLVYAQAALLKELGVTDAQYNQIIFNLDALRDIAGHVKDVVDDTNGSYKKQKDSLADIVEYTEDLIEYETNQRIDTIKDEIEGYKKIVDLKKESLNKTKEENEYEKSIVEKTKEIAKLQSKIDQLALDDSREARAERAKLLEQLSELQGDLSDTQADHALDEQNDALDRLVEMYEEQRNKEIEYLESTISSAEKLYQLAIKRIETGWDTLYQELIDWNTEAGRVLNSEITEAWNAALEAAQKYGSYLKALEAYNSTSTSTNVVATTSVPSILPKYHTGGVVGDASNLDQQEMLAILEKGEAVLDTTKQGVLYRIIDFQKTLSEKLGNVIGSISSPISASFAALTGRTAGSFATAGAGLNFSPDINVVINHSGNMNDSDAVGFGKRVATTALDELYSAFNRRGIMSTNGAKLK